MTFFQKLLSGLPAIAVIGVIVLIFTYKGFLDSDSAKDKKKDIPDLPAVMQPQVTDTIITSKKDGIKYWEIEAKEISLEDNEEKSHAKEVLCRFYDKAGNVYIIFESPEADIDMKNENVFFNRQSKGLMVRSGDIMIAQKLNWDGKKKKVYGNNGVKLFRGDYILTGDKMIGDPETKDVELIGNVSGLYATTSDLKKSFLKK